MAAALTGKAGLSAVKPLRMAAGEGSETGTGIPEVSRARFRIFFNQ